MRAEFADGYSVQVRNVLNALAVLAVTAIAFGVSQRGIPVTTTSTSRPPHFEHLKRLIRSPTRFDRPTNFVSERAEMGRSWRQPRHCTLSTN